MAKNKKSRREVATPVSVVTANSLPLVSVIIPMYNSAKFIPQTLESLCYQTMRDFEVVVVDDCSTDNSVAVVESFVDRLGGLHVVKLRENGGAGSARNVGINFARGKYIAFLDSDDLFTPTALEELTTLAENFQADMLHADQWFKLWDGKEKSVDDSAFTNFNELTNPNNFALKTFRKQPPAQKPELEQFDMAERVRRWINYDYYWATMTTFVRRDFLIANKIYFSNSSSSEDHFFNFNCVCRAEKILRLSKPFYIVRPRIGSISRTDLNAEKILSKWIRIFRTGFNELERIMSGIKFFDAHPDYRYAVLDFFISLTLNYGNGPAPVYTKIPAHMIYPFIKKIFHEDEAALAAYLFNTVNVQRLQLMRLQYEFNRLKASK